MDKINLNEDISSCFLCKKCFKKGDVTVEFFGGYAHWKCFDKQMKENEENTNEV